ncbi:MAG: phosphatidate cytidylyltransferase, partial [Clostridia bacterium]|nr:phosphatidate cytidylyltransferase [Clostridia bacterium]
MLIRVITGVGILLSTIALMIFAHTPAYPIVVALLAFVGVYEYFRTYELSRKWFLVIPAYLLALGMPIGCYYLNGPKEGLFALMVAMLLYFIIVAMESVFFHRQMTMHDAFVAFGGVFYVVSGFSALCALYTASSSYVVVTILPAFMGSWITDTGAYFVGVLFGKHKLCPELSPKKTVEGGLGGIVVCSLAFLVFGFLVSLFTPLTPHYLMLALYAILISIVSQVGDLFMSKLKREQGIKDFGNLFPGHGGVLDRFDSMIPIA